MPILFGSLNKTVIKKIKKKYPLLILTLLVGGLLVVSYQINSSRTSKLSAKRLNLETGEAKNEIIRFKVQDKTIGYAEFEKMKTYLQEIKGIPNEQTDKVAEDYFIEEYLLSQSLSAKTQPILPTQVETDLSQLSPYDRYTQYLDMKAAAQKQLIKNRSGIAVVIRFDTPSMDPVETEALAKNKINFYRGQFIARKDIDALITEINQDPEVIKLNAGNTGYNGARVYNNLTYDTPSWYDPNFKDVFFQTPLNTVSEVKTLSAKWKVTDAHEKPFAYFFVLPQSQAGTTEELSYEDWLKQQKVSTNFSRTSQSEPKTE